MKKLLLTLFIVASVAMGSFAQRFAYVDLKYILNELPEYQTAQQQLDDIADQWQLEIDQKYQEIEKLYNSYQAEQVLLTEEMRKQREDEITAKEKEVKDYQKQKFGYQGELFLKRQELIKPIQDKIYTHIQDLAKTKSYDFIFDKSSGPMMLFSNTKYDLSDEVLQKMGITPSENSGQ